MRLVLAIILVNTFIVLTKATTTSNSDLPPLKIDKNLRQALLKALEDLETESAEQKDSLTAEDLLKKLQDQPIEPENPSTVSTIEDRHVDDAFITFEKFPGDCVGNDPNEEDNKLQNPLFETERVIVNDFTISKEDSPKLEKVIFQKYDNKKLNNNNQQPSTIQKKISESESIEVEKIESKNFKNGILSNIIDDTPKLESSNYEKDGLATSSSNGIASANALIPPSPTAASLVAKNASIQMLQSTTERLSSEMEMKNKSEVNIYPVPLIAAFTVQQDERGNAKSVVPIYKPNGNDALTLQEQLEFKQKLLEKQLAELQEQQYQQTQFLLRQQQIYQEQQRQKQQLYYQEQARLRLLEEQKYHQLKQQSLQPQVFPHQQQFQQQQLSVQTPTLSQQQLPLQIQSLSQPISQQILPLQQHQQNPQATIQQPLGAFSHHNSLSFQLPAKTTNVQFQPSLTFQLPSAIPPTTFNQQNHLERFKTPQVATHQSIPLQNPQTLPRLQTIPQEQKFQQTFEFQPSTATRFNRQEAHGSVGNFGINDNRQLPSRNNAFLELPSQVPAQFITSFNQFRPRTSPSAANQIQQLLYQSGVASDFGKYQGNSNPEDLNIVSKVLALNVGAVPTKSLHKNFFGRA